MSEPRLVRALRRLPVDRVPVWLMRQAGRFLPEYRELRRRHTLLEIVARPDLAAEVTMMPLRRFDLDAAIVFADILLPLPAMGVGVRFARGEGPVVEPRVRAPADVDRLRPVEVRTALAPTLEAIARVRAALPPDRALIGFAGAPFTVASYLIEGGGSQDQAQTKAFLFRYPDAWGRCMERLREVTCDYLAAQVEAGAHAVQLFDSWVGTLAPEDYREFVQPHTRWIVTELRRRHPEAPVIHFGTGTATLLPAIAEVGADAVGLDWRVPLGAARRILGPDVALQGNLDPALLAAGPLDRLRRRVRAIVAEGSRHPGYVFNLGHGVLPQTPLEHVAAVVEEVHGFVPS
jgi:uroporphyrinogen decarboxylase